MGPKTEQLLAEVLELPREGRALLAEKLLETLDTEEEFEVSPEWRAEIRRRCEEIDHGKVGLVSGEAVLKRVTEGLQ